MRVVIGIDGNVILTEQGSMFTRSNAVNRLELYSPYSPLDAVILSFKRQDHVEPMSRYMAYTGISQYNGSNYYVYVHDFSAYQLAAVGTLEMNCKIVMYGGETVLSTGTFYATVEDGGTTNIELLADEESELLTLTQAVESRAVLQPLATEGNFASIDSSGQYADSGVSVSDINSVISGKTYRFNVSIPVSSWNAQTKQATVTVQGVTADWTLSFAPSASSRGEYLSVGGVYGISIGTDSITFECGSIPTATMEIICVGGKYDALS